MTIDVCFVSLVNKAVEFQRDYLTVQSWRKWCLAMVQRATNQNAIPPDDNNDPLGESPALEVIEFRDPKGYFSGRFPFFSLFLRWR